MPFKKTDADLFDALPKKDEIWRHTRTGNEYLVLGTVFNVITRELDVKYAPRYECEYSEFTRQLLKHEQAWMTPNNDGAPRFVRIGTLAEERKAIEGMFPQDDDDDEIEDFVTEELPKW